MGEAQIQNSGWIILVYLPNWLRKDFREHLKQRKQNAPHNKGMQADFSTRHASVAAADARR